MSLYIVHVRHAEKAQCKVTVIPSVKVRFVKEDIKIHTLFFFNLSPGLNQVLVLPFSWKKVGKIVSISYFGKVKFVLNSKNFLKSNVLKSKIHCIINF
mgnify:CR=1 FL=1